MRNSGLLTRCIERAYSVGTAGCWRRARRWRWARIRVPEAIAPLLLKHWMTGNWTTRLMAVKALGANWPRVEAVAEPILEAYMVGALKVPEDPVSNALVRCYKNQPEALLPYLRRSVGESRELLARVAGELATPEMADDMILLSEDPGPEIRASAARALAVAPLSVALPVLAKLIRDDIWFVRLRATSALNLIVHPRAIPFLLEAVRDSNRLVRIKSRDGPCQSSSMRPWKFCSAIVDSHDRYALHAMIAALELEGGFGNIMEQLADPSGPATKLPKIYWTLCGKGSAGLWSTRLADPVIVIGLSVS